MCGGLFKVPVIFPFCPLSVFLLELCFSLENQCFVRTVVYKTNSPNNILAQDEEESKNPIFTKTPDTQEPVCGGHSCITLINHHVTVKGWVLVPPFSDRERRLKRDHTTSYHLPACVSAVIKKHRFFLILKHCFNLSKKCLHIR